MAGDRHVLIVGKEQLIEEVLEANTDKRKIACQRGKKTMGYQVRCGRIVSCEWNGVMQWKLQNNKDVCCSNLSSDAPPRTQQHHGAESGVRHAAQRRSNPLLSTVGWSELFFSLFSCYLCGTQARGSLEASKGKVIQLLRDIFVQMVVGDIWCCFFVYLFFWCSASLVFWNHCSE